MISLIERGKARTGKALRSHLVGPPQLMDKKIRTQTGYVSTESNEQNQDSNSDPMIPNSTFQV